MESERKRWYEPGFQQCMSAGGRFCCDAGFGRTGTVLAAWLIRAKGMSAAEAITHIRAVYASDAVESGGQIEALTEFERTARGGTVG